MSTAAGPWVIAVDGPGGSGKSTVARAVAARLGGRYLDTGAMYRALTWAVLQAGIDPDDARAVAAFAPEAHIGIGTDPDRGHVVVNGTEVTGAIRLPEVTRSVSAVSAVPQVRVLLVAQQQAIIAAARPGIVVEGRDIGTVVAPHAPVKVYLTANPAVRAARRARELGGAARAAATQVHTELLRRDAYDSGRASSPLRQASDAIELDSSELSVEQVVAAIVERSRPYAQAGTS